jgi:hypothetical protein
MGASSETQPLVAIVTFLAADGTTIKGVNPAQSGPYRIDAVAITNTDTIAHNVAFYIHTGAGNTLLGSVAVPAGTGLAGVKPVELIEAWNLTQLTGFNLDATRQLYAGMEVAVAGAFVVTITGFGGLY